MGSGASASVAAAAACPSNEGLNTAFRELFEAHPNSLEFNGTLFKFVSARPLELERVSIYAAQFSEMIGAERVIAVTAEGGDGQKEMIAVVKDCTFSIIGGKCAITLADLLPSEAIEYTFAEAPDKWALAPISREALETYRKTKFGLWKDLLLKSECEAQLRRMLQAGVVSAIYDDVVFPTPEEYRHHFKVTCEKTGRIVNIPHPVVALRIWNASECKYDMIEPALEGAPLDAEKDTWWAEFLKSLKEERGAEYIEGLMANASEDDEPALAVADLKLEVNGTTYSAVSTRPLELERVDIYAGAFPEMIGADQVRAIIAEADGGKKEFTAVVKGTVASLVKGECAITLAELLPSDAIEYAFAETPEKWALAKISRESLEAYRKTKFGQWKDLILKGECEAQLRRMLQAGVVSAIYDDVVFPTPEEYQRHFKVTCEKTGRIVNIPHPVAALRIWNAVESKYDMIEPALEGAPPDAEKDTWWAEFLTSLKEERGAEYIDGLLANEAADDE